MKMLLSYAMPGTVLGKLRHIQTLIKGPEEEFPCGPATGLGGSGGEREIFVSEADGGGKCKVGGSHTTREHRRGARSPRL